MQTDFEFLRRLERDLTEVARTEARPTAMSAPPRRHPAWKAWTTTIAALLGIALFVGFASQFLEGGADSNQFSSVGSAVDAPGAFSAPRGGNETTDEGSAPIGVVPGASAAPEPDVGSSTKAPEQQKGEAAPQSDLSKIIRDGEIAVSIDDGSFPSRSADVSRIAIANRGSVLSSSTSGGDSGTFTLRIPAANFDRAMNQLAKLGTVDSSEVHGQDVTSQYVDLKAHMKIYLSRRRVLFGLMQQANTIGETLTIQHQLDDVQLKIDQIQGQLNFINKQVAESTIKVDMHEPDAAVAPTPGEVENPSLGRAWDHAVQGSLNVLAAVLIGLGYLIPIGVVVAVGYAIMRLVRRRSVEDG